MPFSTTEYNPLSSKAAIIPLSQPNRITLYLGSPDLFLIKRDDATSCRLQRIQVHLFICFYQLCSLAKRWGMIQEQRSRLTEAKINRYQCTDNKEKDRSTIFPHSRGLRWFVFHQLLLLVSMKPFVYFEEELSSSL